MSFQNILLLNASIPKYESDKEKEAKEEQAAPTDFTSFIKSKI